LLTENGFGKSPLKVLKRKKKEKNLVVSRIIITFAGCNEKFVEEEHKYESI
jgi:hypothetical protein